MASVIIRNLPEETHRALKTRAEKNGRSTEAELRHIIEDVVRPQGRIQLGTHLAQMGKDTGMSEAEWTIFQNSMKRDKGTVEPIGFQE